MNSDLLSKIRKLFALAKGAGTTEAEASLAAVRAQELLERHNLTTADLVDASPDSIGTITSAAGGLKRVPRWVGWIATAVAETSYTAVILVPGVGLKWIGTEANIRASILLVQFLTEQARNLRRAHPNTDRQAGEDFLRGCGARIGRRLRDAYRARISARQAVGETTALVVLDQARARVDQYVKSNLKLTPGRRTAVSQTDDYLAGSRAGSTVTLVRHERVSNSKPLVINGTVFLA